MLLLLYYVNSFDLGLFCTVRDSTKYLKKRKKVYANIFLLQKALPKLTYSYDVFSVFMTLAFPLEKVSVKDLKYSFIY